MIPQLHIYKRKIPTRTGFTTRIYFTIVDGAVPKKYPLNFVCTLPRYRCEILKKKKAYFKEFGEEWLDVVHKLLSDAANANSDPEIVKEIHNRITAIEKPQKPKRQ